MATRTNLVATGLLLCLCGAGSYYVVSRVDTDASAVASASIDWPRVAGLVTHSDLVGRQSEKSDADEANPQVDVNYEYVVDNKLYRNDVVRFDQQLLPVKRKEVLVGSYPSGKRVDVFYDPDNPGNSVLERGSWSPKH
ncbi:MAG: DUF3592 domain-containing protein [Woeseiaceae bacterium]|nr:DUF3592 domain-containing protein [Woeseiaceae bacterium]